MTIWLNFTPVHAECIESYVKQWTSIEVSSCSLCFVPILSNAVFPTCKIAVYTSFQFPYIENLNNQLSNSSVGIVSENLRNFSDQNRVQKAKHYLNTFYHRNRPPSQIFEILLWILCHFRPKLMLSYDILP